MKAQVTVNIDTDALGSYTDQHLATLWHAAQANPAPHGDHDAGALVEHVGREIIKRFLANTSAELYNHQGADHYWWNLIRFAKWDGSAWVAKGPEDADGNQEQQTASGAA